MEGLFMSEENNKTRVKLTICGSQFVIKADESVHYIQKIAKMVDERIKQLDDSDPKLNLHMATIVAALNYCDMLEKEKVITRELIKKTDDCEAIAKDATIKLNKLLVENAQLREEKEGLHKIIAELKAGTYSETIQSDNPTQAAQDPLSPDAPASPEAPAQDTNNTSSKNAVPIPPASLESIKTAPMQLNNIKSQAISSASPKNYSSKKHKK